MEFMKKLSLRFFCSLFFSSVALCMEPLPDRDTAPGESRSQVRNLRNNLLTDAEALASALSVPDDDSDDAPMDESFDDKDGNGQHLWLKAQPRQPSAVAKARNSGGKSNRGTSAQSSPEGGKLTGSFYKEQDDHGFFWLDHQPFPNDPAMQAYFEDKTLHRWCSKKYNDIIPAVIQGGATVFEKRYSKLSFTPADPQKYLEALKNVCWFMYSLHPTFNNGMFVVEETKHNGRSMPLWNFFHHYFEITTDNAHRNSVYFSNNGLSYARHSTHFSKSQKAGKTQIGIDSRKKQGDWEEYDLPHGCSTMLCGELAESDYDNNGEYGRWFLKPEKYGLCGALATARHAEGVIGSACRKILPKVLGASWGSWIAGSNDQNCHCKEHLPLALKEEYQRVCIKNRIVPSDVGSIAELLAAMNEYDGDQFKPLEEIIRNNYPHAEKRFGQEVYLTDRELQAPALYCWLAKKNDPAKDEAFEWAKQTIDLLEKIKGRSAEKEPDLHAELFEIQKKVDSLTLEKVGGIGGLEDSVLHIFDERLV